MFRQEECLEIHCHRIWGTSLGDSTWGKIGTQKWFISEKVHFWVQLCLSYLNWFSISATSDLFPYLHKVIQQIILISLTFLEKDKHNPHYSWIPPFWDKHNKTEGDFSPCVPYNKCHIFIQFFQYIDFAWFLCVCVCVSGFGGHMPDSNGESDAYLMTINWTKVPVLGTWWRLEYDKSNKNHRTASETE